MIDYGKSVFVGGVTQASNLYGFLAFKGKRGIEGNEFHVSLNSCGNGYEMDE